MNSTYKNIKQQLESKEEELKQLKQCKEYMWVNFAATREEQDKVWDVIAQVIDRKEKRISELKQELLLAI